MSKTVRVSAVALLLVTAGLSSFVAIPAAADTYTKTVDSSRAVVVETSGIDQAKIEIWGKYTENGNDKTHFLRRKTVNTDSKHYLVDQESYESYEVKVTTATGTSSVSIYGDSYSGGGLGYTSLGHTGADTDLTCGLGAQAGSMFGTFFTDCNPVPERSINTTELNKNQTKVEIYKDFLTIRADHNQAMETYDNYLQDTRSIALMEGKSAYIRALNNGSTEAVARVEAKSAVSDYLAIQQKQMVEDWNDTVAELQYLDQRERNGSVDPHYLEFYTDWNDGTNFVWEAEIGTQQNNIVSKSYQLVNNTGQNVTMLKDHSNTAVYGGPPGNNESEGKAIETIRVAPPTSDYSTAKINALDWVEQWKKVERMNRNVRAEMDVFVNNTYSQYQSGEINNSDLIDPYLAQRDYGPEPGNFSAWATTSLTLLGTNSPEALESTGSFNVTDETTGDTYNGMLLSDENPASGGFSAGTTYDAAALDGTQYVVTASEVEELTGNFTVNEITNDQGETVTNVTYRNVTYSTNTTDGYQQLLTDLSEIQAAIDAKQTAAASVGGGGSGSSGGMPEVWGYPAWAVAVAGVAGVIILNNLTRP